MRRGEGGGVRPALLVALVAVVLVVGIVAVVLVGGSDPETAGDADGASTSSSSGDAAGGSTSSSVAGAGADGAATEGGEADSGSGSEAGSGSGAPIELRPEVLDEALENAQALFPAVAGSDRARLEGLATASCGVVAADAGGDVVVVADGIVAGITDVAADAGVARFTAGALMIVGRYVVGGGCGDAVVVPDDLGAELARRVSEHLGSP